MNSFIHRYIHEWECHLEMNFVSWICKHTVKKYIAKTHSHFQYTVLDKCSHILFISALFYQRHCDGKPTLEDLPEDCLRCIFRKLSNHSDIIHTGQTNQTNHTVSSHMLLWKQLCFFHFTDQQLLVFLPQELDINEDRVNWRYIYRRCYK